MRKERSLAEKIKIARSKRGQFAAGRQTPVSTNHEVEAVSVPSYRRDNLKRAIRRRRARWCREAARTLPAEAVETVDMFELGRQSDESRVSTTIKIGDLVLLGESTLNPKVDCVVNAEGFFTQRVFPKSKMDYFFIAAFRVTPALQYDALVGHTQLLVRRPSFSRGSSVSGRSSSVDKGRASSFSRRPSLEADRHNDLKGSAQTLIEEKRKNKAKLDKVLESEASETALCTMAISSSCSTCFWHPHASNDGSLRSSSTAPGTRYSKRLLASGSAKTEVSFILLRARLLTPLFLSHRFPFVRFRKPYDDEILLNCVARGSENARHVNTARACSRADLDGLNEKHLVLKDKLGDDVPFQLRNSELLHEIPQDARYPGTRPRYSAPSED